jgi:hypothetical protein
MASTTRLVNKEVEYRRKGAQHTSKGQTAKEKENSPTDAVMIRILSVVCYWRTAVAQRVGISPVMVLPDSVVGYILKHRPQGALGVVRCMLRWVTAHRQKHAERFRREAEAAAAAGMCSGKVATGASNSETANGKRWAAEEKNPFAWYLDNWRPGWSTLLAAPWLARLLYCAYSGRTRLLPVQACLP